MARIVAVHGIGQQQSGRQQLLSAWRPALADGVERAQGRQVPLPDLDLAFYADLFFASDAPTKGPSAPAHADWLEELDDEEGTDPGSDTVGEPPRPTKAYTRTPRFAQAFLRAMEARLGAAAVVLFIGELSQVRRYLTDADLKARVDERVRQTVDPECRVLIAHSLGSVVAYEFLRQNPGTAVQRLVTIGSPLGLRMVRRKIPQAPGFSTETPAVLPVEAWVNIRDEHDPVACAGSLAKHWPQAHDCTVSNGADAHSATRYLGKAVTGAAVSDLGPSGNPIAE